MKNDTQISAHNANDDNYITVISLNYYVNIKKSNYIIHKNKNTLE